MSPHTDAGGLWSRKNLMALMTAVSKAHGNISEQEMFGKIADAMIEHLGRRAQAQTGCGDPSCQDPTCVYGRGGPYQVTLCDDGGWMVHDIGDVLCVAAQGDSEQKARAICAAMNAKPASHGTDESRLTRYAADPEIAGDDRQSMEAVPSKGIVTGGTASTPSLPSAPAQAPGVCPLCGGELEQGKQRYCPSCGTHDEAPAQGVRSPPVDNPLRAYTVDQLQYEIAMRASLVPSATLGSAAK